MGEIAGARDELDRLGGFLRDRMVDLITQLTPAANLDLLFLDEPTPADRQEPPRYRYSATIRGNRAADASETARRALDTFAAAGWAVAQARDADATIVTGTRDGSSIEVRIFEAGPSVRYTASTRAIPLFEPEEFVRPDPVRTADTLTAGYVLCYECDGLGACPECGGRGWLPDGDGGRKKCTECSGQRECPICRGAGQIGIFDLSPFQRRYYPDLGE